MIDSICKRNVRTKSCERRFMKDTIGKIPSVKNKRHALEEILKIAKDKRTHVMLEDCNNWLELKMKVIGILAVRGLKCK